ncbi:MAG: alpha/beta fold hydrolase [Gemmatimonadaceae bacterium]
MRSPSYHPAWWVPGPHLKTLWGKLFRPRPRVATRVERWDTPDGDFLELHRLDTSGTPATPTGSRAAPRHTSSREMPRLLILHGLEGSARSHYALGLMAEAGRRGWDADLLIWRSCGTEMNRAARFYHSGETTDLDFVVRRLVEQSPGTPLVIAGVSLGGNVLLKWLGERGTDLPPGLRGAAGVSVPFDLARGARHLDRGFARVYQASFVRSLRRKAVAKRARYPALFPDAALGRLRTIYQFDDAVTAPLHGFRDAEDYYARSSSIHYLARVRLPTLLLSAVDDPFLPAGVLDEVRALARDNAALHIEFVREGGHVGFVAGTRPWRPVYYAERRVVDFLSSTLGVRRDSAPLRESTSDTRSANPRPSP